MCVYELQFIRTNYVENEYALMVFIVNVQLS